MTSLVSVLLLSAVAFGQTPAFEVATIKPSEALNAAKMMSGAFRIGAIVDGGRAEFRFMALADLIQYAYKVKNYQVSGPDWIKTERFDIQAKLPEGATREQVPEMLQALLADRFQLKLRREQTEHSVFGLVVAKGGLKLKETTPDRPVAAGGGDGKAAETAQRFTMTRSGDGGGSVGGPVRMSRELGMHVERKMTMAVLADFLSRFVGRPVIDMTDTKETYAISMDLSLGDIMRSGNGAVVAVSRDGAPVNPGSLQTDDSGSASIFSEIQKLGLKLEPRKAPVELLSVASAERKPSEN
jgi:uncharacterized protein (TIGR03435 family)